MKRRSFLRGAGAAVALPFLESIAGGLWPHSPAGLAMAQGAQAPKARFIAFYVPCGIHMPAWTPATEGSSFTLPPILEPLAEVRDAVTVVSGLRNHPARPDGPGDHAAGTGSFLSAAHCYKTEGANIANGVSIDQVIANQVGQNHRFPSLVLGSEGGGNAGGCDSGYSCAYSRNISWVSETTPAAKETNPKQVFDRLFGGDDAGLTERQIQTRKRYRKSILDFVAEDTTRLKTRLGRTDNRKLDEYLTSVRELERQIELAEQSRCRVGAAPGQPPDLRGHVQQMLDLTVLALRCDLSPVVTFMLGNGGSNRPFPFLGISDGHHQISHHQDNPANHAMLQTIDTWEVSQLAYLMQQLRAVETQGSTLLDETVIFFSSEIEDGNSHSHDNLPILLCGGAGGQLESGRHVRFGAAPPIANLFVSLATLCGARVDGFGDDSTGPLLL